VVEKLVLEKSLDGSPDSTFGMGLSSGSQLPALDSSSRLGLKSWQKIKPFVEILCNNQASICTYLYIQYFCSLFRCTYTVQPVVGKGNIPLSLEVYIKYLVSAYVSTD
jgi:hypothetical protein